MTKWEYRLESPRSETLGPVLAAAGSEGWELLYAAYMKDGTARLIYKRPRTAKEHETSGSGAPSL